MALTPSDVLDGKWRIERELGKGGMATVFLAHEIALDRRVAVKMLEPAICSDLAMVSRFEREGRLMAQLDHPNIVPVLAVGLDGAQPFIVMKYLDGRTLKDHLRERPKGLSDSETLAIVGQVCAGLTYMHGRSLVHRDIKPGNIFISPVGHVTILDLGVARDLKSRQITQAGFILGTPEYMAPEQITGAHEVDHRTDLYSLGVLVFEMLSGRLPFSGSNALSLAERHANAVAPDLSEVAPWVASPMGSVLRRALAKRPDDRFQSAGEFFRACSEAVGSGTTVTSTVPEFSTVPTDPALPRLASSQVAITDVATRRTEPIPKRQRFRLAVGAVGVAAVGALVAFAWPRDGGRASPSPPPAATGQTEASSVRPTSAPQSETATPAPPQPGASATQMSATEQPPIPVSAPPERPTPSDAVPVHVSPHSKTARHAPDPARLKPGQLRVIALEHGQLSWASVFVDGDAQGEAPVSMSLASGTHKIRLERPGYPTTHRDVPISPGQTSTVRIEIAP